MASHRVPDDAHPTPGDRGWAVLAHLSIVLFLIALPFPFVTGLVLVLLLRITVGRTPGFVRRQVEQAFNYQLLVVLVAIGLLFLGVALDAETLIGWLLLFVILGAFGVATYAAVQAYQGREYRYPVALPVLR